MIIAEGDFLANFHLKIRCKINKRLRAYYYQFSSTSNQRYLKVIQNFIRIFPEGQKCRFNGHISHNLIDSVSLIAAVMRILNL